jgi:hypothetical protein
MCEASQFDIHSFLRPALLVLRLGMGYPSRHVMTLSQVGKKGKLSLYLSKHYAMKAYRGMDVYTHVFLTSALVGCEWSASRPSRFTPGERASRTH